MTNQKALEKARVVIDHFAGSIEAMYRPEKRYRRLAAVDDDVFSAYVAAWHYHDLKRRFGYYPKVDCIGGFGLMSGKINPKRNGERLSEAEMLRYVLVRLGVKEDDIGYLCEGSNTGKNLSLYAKELDESKTEEVSVLFCLTKRLAGRFYLTQLFQQSWLDANYVWIETENECQLYNGKALAGCLPYFSEAASIYDRYVRYATSAVEKNRFMACLPDPLPTAVEEAGKWLCRHYVLKMPQFSLKKLGQYVSTYLSFLLQRKQCRYNLETNIMDWQRELIHRFGLKREVCSDSLQGGLGCFVKAKN